MLCSGGQSCQKTTFVVQMVIATTSLKINKNLEKNTVIQICVCFSVQAPPPQKKKKQRQIYISGYRAIKNRSTLGGRPGGEREETLIFKTRSCRRGKIRPAWQRCCWRPGPWCWAPAASRVSAGTSHGSPPSRGWGSASPEMETRERAGKVTTDTVKRIIAQRGGHMGNRNLQCLIADNQDYWCTKMQFYSTDVHGNLQ